MSSALPSRAIVLALGAALLFTLAAGLLVGARLGRWSSQPAVRTLDVAAPASAPVTTSRDGTSPAGFTGFGGPPALQGDVLQAGTVTSSGAGSVSIGLEGGGADITFAGTGRLFKIAPAARALAVGDRVVIRLDGSGAAAVLRSSVEAPESASR